MAGGKGETTFGRAASNRVVGGLAEWFVRLKRHGWDNYTLAFHGGDEVGPRLLAQIAKKTGLRPEDL